MSPVRKIRLPLTSRKIGADAQEKSVGARLKLALHAAKQAEKIILRHYRGPGLQVDIKKDRTVVTEADRSAERKLRQLIQASFRDDGIIGEELGAERESSEYCWILDPIDGTESFVRGVP